MIQQRKSSRNFLKYAKSLKFWFSSLSILSKTSASKYHCLVDCGVFNSVITGIHLFSISTAPSMFRLLEHHSFVIIASLLDTLPLALIPSIHLNKSAQTSSKREKSQRKSNSIVLKLLNVLIDIIENLKPQKCTRKNEYQI